MKPTLRDMLEFVENPGSVLLDRFHRKPLASWLPRKTRIVIHEAPLEVREHVSSFIKLYQTEKHIGLSYA